MKFIRSTLLAVVALLLVAINPIEAEASNVMLGVHTNPLVNVNVEKSLLKLDFGFTTTHFSKEKVPVESVTYYLDPVYDILSEEYVSPDWDYRKRIQDIDILIELLVNQLGVSKTKAAAIIGNVVFEDSFMARTNSVASVKSLQEAENRIGTGQRGFGIVQWTARFRQITLLDYLRHASTHLDWEMASILAETTLLYNELKYSNLLGDLSEEGEIEDCTGIIGVHYEAYGNHPKEWVKSNGEYKSLGSPRYSYACSVYNYMMKY